MFARWWLALMVAGAVAQAAENDDKPKWDVNAPAGERRDVRIDTRSGTWLSVEVSPDGQRVLFDLLGDIYELPISGGTARPLTSGLAWDMQPRYSPDGKHIAFTSDRGGGDNLWIMRTDATQPRQVTKEDFRLLNNPAWHPNGKYIAARKHFTTRRSLGAGEIWLYSIDGGEGVQLVKRPSEEFQKELGEPAFAPDGKHLYFTQNSTPGDTFIYAQDSNSEVFQIRRYELASGKIHAVVTGAGGAVRPTPSPDGRYLAFVRRLRTPSSVETALYLKDLISGAERPLYTALDRDMQETWAVNGVYPNIDWTPDSKSVVLWAGGGIRRIDVGSGTATDIPFHISDTRTSIAPPRFKVSVAPEEVTAKMVRFASVAPDSARVVYEAFGKLWLKQLPDATPRRLTRDDSNAFELFASWSRDGKRVTFVRWTDAGLGEIHVVDGGGGRSRAVTRQPGHYFDPRFSPDGATIVFQKGTGGQLTSPLWSTDPGIYRVPSSGGDAVRLTDEGHAPHFGARGERVFYVHDHEPAKESQPAHELVSVDINGKDRRVHAKAHYATSMLVSPSGEWLTFRENYHVFATPMPPAGQVELSPKAKSLPLRRVSDLGGEYPSWVDGDTLTWVLGPTLYRAEMTDAFAPAPEGVSEDVEDAQPKYGAALANLSITRPAAKPTGTLALTGARIITMNARDEVIENGTIIVRDNRIVAIGPTNTVQIPSEARRLDVAGRTIMPGIIDIHAHGSQGTNDIVPQQNWEALAHLALGVTTIHDPSNQASEIFAAAEYQRAGLILASRIFSTGETIYGAHSEDFASIDTLEDARAHVQRLKAQGAISVKNYNQPRREQRQMVVTAAREAGLMSVAEGGSLYPMDMTIIADGNTGLEHNMPPEKFYDDVLQFWPATGVGYTPTLVVTFGGPGAEHLFYQSEDVWKHPILSRYVPPHVLQPRSVRRQMVPDTDYQPVRDSAANAKALTERGVLVNTGAHGQREGMGSHWEMWGFVLGGMSNMQALKAATINPARYMGFDAELGSLEPGKLADLLVLDGNPLEDIRTTDDIAYVMLNGRVYEGGSMEEKVTGEFKLKPFYWQEAQ
jgi:imidazolonepropionase-like amidohydrolase/Tol biopolymer transport system component